MGLRVKGLEAKEHATQELTGSSRSYYKDPCLYPMLSMWGTRMMLRMGGDKVYANLSVDP